MRFQTLGSRPAGGEVLMARLMTLRPAKINRRPARTQPLRRGAADPIFARQRSRKARIMSDSGSYHGGARAAADDFDPWLHPELYRGVLTRRAFAFLIDLIVLSIPVVLACIFIAMFGVVTLGLGWALFWLISPASVIWAIVYYGASLGGPHSATLGMRAMNLELRSWSGAPGYFVLGAAHAVLFWVSVSFFTPLIVLAGLFN